MPDKIRLDHKCEQITAERFLSTVGTWPDCVLKDFQPVSDKCHIIRYKYLLRKEKVAIVYDTKAHLLSVTATPEIVRQCKELLAHDSASPTQDVAAKGNPPAGSPKPQQPSKQTGAPKEKPKQTTRQEKPKQTTSEKPNQATPKQAPPEKSKPQPKAVAAQSVSKKNDRRSEKKPTAAPQAEEGQDYTVKKFGQEQFDRVLKGIKRLRGVTYRLEGVVESGDATVKTYVIKNNDGQKVKLRYMPVKKILQLQGKRSNLYGEVQAVIAGDTDFKSAVTPHIELNKNFRTGEVQKMLKKRLPDALEFLSEQSKIDLTIGLLDIYNNEIKLTDYSSLLTPPYRGLEKFISDLQKAQGIEVKMIGQAFDKTDGKYVLKGGYQRRIRSVVYAEVLAALYTEYFARRNFYLHSDNSEESSPRMIADKNEARTIFDRLLDTINYNSKKLKEIGFSL